MQRKSAVFAMVAAGVLLLMVSPSASQCNPSCQGDLNSDQQVTVDELIVAVNNALRGCQASPEQIGCLATGGTLSTALCCASAPEFPDTCVMDACSCTPESSREVALCDCGARSCFYRTERACFANP